MMDENKKLIPESDEIIKGEATEYIPPEVMADEDLEDASGNGFMFVPVVAAVNANVFANVNAAMNANAATNANVTAVANANEVANANISVNANTT